MPGSDGLPLSDALNLKKHTPEIAFHDYPYWKRVWETVMQPDFIGGENTIFKIVITSPDAEIIEIATLRKGEKEDK